MLLGRLGSCPSGEGLEAGWVSTERETVRQQDEGLSAYLCCLLPWALESKVGA